MFTYYAPIAAAYVRGHARQIGRPELDPAELTTPLGDLDPTQLDRILSAGKAAGLPLHYFKRTMPLARVQWALGVLRGMQSASLLDIGSGRGAFLWPLLDAFRHSVAKYVRKGHDQTRPHWFHGQPMTPNEMSISGSD